MATISEIDQVLIRYADTLSLNAFSYKIGGALTPEQCGSRITQLLDAPDWLTAAQQDQLVTMKLRQLIVELQEMTLTARIAEVLIRALEGLGARLDRRAQATEKDLSTLYAFQGTVMLDAIGAAMDNMKARMVSDGKITDQDWDDAMESSMRFAELVVQQHELAPAHQIETRVLNIDPVEPS